MPRFSSVEHSLPETRRLLRARLRRYLAWEPHHPQPAHNGRCLPDEAMLSLLQSLNLEFGSEWVRMLATYASALPPGSDEPPLQDLVAAGWARLVWGRIKVPSEISLTFHRAKDRAGTFAAVLNNRFDEHYRLKSDAHLEDELLTTAQGLEKGEIEFRHLSCRSPKWVAARLWERILLTQNDISALRIWIDYWNLLWAPEIAPSQVWDGDAGERFRQAALQVIETDKALEDWGGMHLRFAKEIAVISDQDPQHVQSNIPAPPDTLVDRALWLENNRILRLVYASSETCSDLSALVRLLLIDINEQPFTAAPHPLAVKLLNLAGARPDILLTSISFSKSYPTFLADMLLHPPSCALACFIIAQWKSTSSAFDRALMNQGDELAKAAAFEDAISILAWWLEKGLIPPAEVAALSAWLHRIGGAGFIDDVAAQEGLRLTLNNALFSLDPSILKLIISSLTEENESFNRLGGRFAAALEIVAHGDFYDQVCAAPLVEQYIDAVTTNDFSLSAQRIGTQSAAALFAIAQKIPGELNKFLYPIDVQQRLADADQPDANPYTIANDISRSLRTHIRILSRAIVGHGQPEANDLVQALTQAVWSGALNHREKGRVAAFAPRNEVNTFGPRHDRPIAVDLAAALTTLSGNRREELLSAILETDEPMVLAQLLPFAPHESRSAIERRLNALPPSKAGETLSLTELQARIDELLSARAFDAAEKYMAEEAQIQTFGHVQGREVIRLRSILRLRFARHEWKEIMTTQTPTSLSLHEKEEAANTVQFYKGLALLIRPENRDPEGAENIFNALRQRRPAIAAYAVNAIAAKISVILRTDIFGRLEGTAARNARQVLLETQGLMNGTTPLTPADRETLRLNEAILRLALNEPADALALLPPSASALLNERVQAYRALALSRLGRQREAVTVIKATEEILGKTELLEAAWAQIKQGVPFSGSAGISPNDDPVVRVRQAYQELHVLDPIQQTAVVSIGDDPFTTFVIDQVRGASASIVSLVSVMDVTKLDGCEDDVTAVIRELLLSRLEFLKWSVPDQSKGGFTPKGNPGERDLLIMRGSTILTVIEAVICRSPIHWQTMQDSLRKHFQKLLAYATCRLFFHLTYIYDQDIQGVLNQLKTSAKQDTPPGLAHVSLTDISLTDSRPSGFVARYNDGQGEVKVVFLALNMGQELQKAAAAASAVAAHPP
jgi:hypothetical protein